MPGLYISAAHKSSGKTTVSIGLCAALTAAGKTVQAFKKGPDYIDPHWLARATGRDCFNLDFFTMQADEITEAYGRHSQQTDISLIEGNKGLYDGLDLDGSNSNAALAALLQTPVILVLDARGMTRGIAPLVLGYQAFDTNIQIAGVILNQLGGSRHEDKLRKVIEHYTDVSVVGAIHHDDAFDIDERHLGLVPSHEDPFADSKIARLGEVVAAQVDLDNLLNIAARAPQASTPPESSSSLPTTDLRIGIARSAAFGFYYSDDLLRFRELGVELVDVDIEKDSARPDLDGLFIGGGFPETQMPELDQNSGMLNDIRQAIENGLPTYAECGGLMYLSRSISWQGHTHRMAGVIPGDIVVEKRPQGRGYVRIAATDEHPWAMTTGETIHAHEFHYSRFNNLDKDARFAFSVKRGTGIDGEHDGYTSHNLLASYTHQRHTRDNPWVDRFVQYVRDIKQSH